MNAENVSFRYELEKRNPASMYPVHLLLLPCPVIRNMDFYSSDLLLLICGVLISKINCKDRRPSQQKQPICRENSGKCTMPSMKNNRI